MTFTPDIPTANMSLGTSRTKVVGNFTALFNTISTNHYEPNAVNDGKHIYVQMPALASGFPTNPAGQLSLYVKEISGRSTVFYKKDNSATEWQLTGIDPSKGQPGYTYLPGGMLMQWAVQAPGGSSGTPQITTFPVAFNNDFDPVVTITATKPSGSTNDASVYFIDLVTSGSTYTGFRWSYSGSSITKILYMAIGPKA